MDKTSSVFKAQSKQKQKKPPMYMVFMHNDDYTTMEFVIYVLMTIFNKQIEEAAQLMLEIHTKGIALVGIYTREIATNSVQKLHELAKKKDYPLLATIEETIS